MNRKASNKKIKIVGILLAVLLAVITGCAIGQKYLETQKPRELTTVRVPIDMWPGNFWVVVANAKGFFEEEGLKADLIDVSANYNQWVKDLAEKDVIDTMIFAAFDLVDKNISGADLVAVFVSDSSEGAEGLVAKKEFKKLADLKGKRIGVELGSYLDFFLEVAMQDSGINANEYTKINLVTEDIVNSFEKENLDAAFMWEPQLSETATAFNLQKIFDTSYIRGLSPQMFVFKRQFTENNPETIQALVRVWAKSSNYLLTHKEEAYQLMTQVDFAGRPGQPYSYDEVVELASQDVILGVEDNLKILSHDAGFKSLYGNLQFVSRFIQRSRTIDNPPNTDNMIVDFFIRNISRKR